MIQGYGRGWMEPTISEWNLESVRARISFDHLLLIRRLYACLQWISK